MNLTKEIRRLSVNDTIETPSSTPPMTSYIASPSSQQSTGHESSRSIPPMLPVPTSYRSNTTPSPTPDSDHVAYSSSNRHVTTPPSSVRSSSNPALSYPLTIRPPPAVARLAGKEKKKNVSQTGIHGPPTSHPSSPAKEPLKSGIMSWGKKDKDTGRAESKWEAGVIGREKARVVLDGNNKR